MALTKAPEELLDRSFTTGLSISTADNTSQLILTSTDADSSEGPVLELYRNSASPADADVGGQIEFHAENDADEKITYATIRVKTADVSDGTEDGTLAFQTITAGSNRNRLNIQADETVINEDSRDLDFRVESNDSANMLVVDGGNNKVLIEAQNTASVTDAASMIAASVFEINGDAGEGSDILRFFALANGTGAYGMEVSNSSGASTYDLCINPINAGNVGIGTLSPDTYLDIEYSSTVQTKGIHITNSQPGGYGSAITWNAERSDNNSLEIAGRLSVQGENSWAGDSTEESCMIFELTNESTLQEHMRLTHRGQLCFNTTSPHSNSTMLHVESGSSSQSTPCVYFADTDGGVEGNSTILELAFDNDDSFSSANYIIFTDEGGTQGEVKGTGDGTVDYDTSSDERLKDNIRDTGSKWDMINSIQVRDFEWKRSGNTNTAFIAQELYSVYPEAASKGGADPKEDPWMVNYARVTPILTKALQEAMARIESLEAEVNKLKGE